MKYISSVLFVCFLFSFVPANAQYQGAKNGLSVKFLLVDYKTPILEEFSPLKEFGTGAEITYSRYLTNSVNLLFPFRIGSTDVPDPNTPNAFLSNRIVLGGDALIQLQLFKENNFLVPHLYAGFGTAWEDQELLNLQVPLGGGFNFRLTPHFYLTTSAEYRLSVNNEADNIQFGAGLLFLLGKPPMNKTEEQVEEEVIEILPTDKDGDGLPDEEDNCPEEAGIAALGGCPDMDGDGVADKKDTCPDMAGLISLNGCPDTDGDGLADQEDKCPDQPGEVANEGCPIVDTDGDGVADDEDKCPNDAGTPSLSGCPDTDSDGVADMEDTCPNIPGNASASGCPDADSDGIADKDDKCPDSAGVGTINGCPEITAEEKEVLESATYGVQFGSGSNQLLISSNTVLNQIADIMQKYPDYRLRISGHTDSIGSSKTNLALSQKRAKACFDYIVSKGVDSNRITHQGFGEAQPIANNKYKEGREKNRRVEFELFLQE